MKDIVVATLPIKPQKETNIGMLIAPTIMDYLGTCLNVERIMNINLLNTYQDKSDDIHGYVDTLNKSMISYDSLYIDTNYVDKLLIIIDILYQKGIIQRSYQKVIRCDCGCIDMLDQSVNNNAKLYENRNGNLYCKRCNSECKTYYEEVLIFKLKEKSNNNIAIFPSFLKKEIKSFETQFNDTVILISKKRDTGFKHLNFNIDIDFMWLIYFNLFPQENQILIASNHQLFIMYLMNYISKITSDKKLLFVASPYMKGNLAIEFEKYNSKSLESFKKLYMLYNLKWNQKDCNWSDTIFKYLNGISETKLNNLYKAMLYSARSILEEYQALEKVVNYDLTRCTNMQDNIKLMKKMYKDGVI